MYHDPCYRMTLEGKPKEPQEHPRGLTGMMRMQLKISPTMGMIRKEISPAMGMMRKVISPAMGMKRMKISPAMGMMKEPKEETKPRAGWHWCSVNTWLETQILALTKHQAMPVQYLKPHRSVLM